MKTLIYVLITIMLSGCASLFNTEWQEVVVETNSRSESETICELVNEEGIWVLSAGLPNSIHRDGNRMSVKCVNEDEYGFLNVVPEFDGEFLALNILLDACIFSCLIDGMTNSWFSYSDTIYVPMIAGTAPYHINMNLTPQKKLGKLSEWETEIYLDFKRECYGASDMCHRTYNISALDKFNIKRLTKHIDTDLGVRPRITKQYDKTWYVYTIMGGSVQVMQDAHYRSSTLLLKWKEK